MDFRGELAMARDMSFDDHSRDNIDQAPVTDASLFNRFEVRTFDDIENTIWHKPSDLFKDSSLPAIIVNLQKIY